MQSRPSSGVRKRSWPGAAAFGDFWTRTSPGVRVFSFRGTRDPGGACLARWAQRAGLWACLLALTTAPRCAVADTFDHGHAQWDGVLRQRVRGGLVDYSGLRRAPEGLRRYLDAVRAVSRREFDSWQERPRLAFLLNAYNAFTLQLVADHYPVTTIKDIRQGLHGPWDLRVGKLLEEPRTLNQIEHDLVRKHFDDPRVHFALVCAARGCPPLRPEAYQSDRLEAQLEDQARQFFATSFKNRVDHPARRVWLSPILKWYASDFEKGSGTVLDAIRRYWPAKSRAPAGSEGYRIGYTDYDWSLNDLSAQ